MNLMQFKIKLLNISLLLGGVFFLFGSLIFPSKIYAVTVQNYNVDTNTARERVGYPAISDPSSYLVFPAYSWTPGGLGETLHHGPIASGGNSFISNKAEPAATVGEQNKVFVSIFDLGVEPGEKIASFLETGDATSIMQWQYLNGKPSGIFNYQWYRSSVGQSLNSYHFTYNDKFQSRYTLNGINYIGFSIKITGSDGSNNITGAVDTSVPGQPVITLFDAYSGYYLAFGASQANEYYVDTVYEDPRYTLNTEKTSTANSETFAGLRATGLADTNASWKTVFSMSRTKATAIASVRNGINNANADYTSATTFWQNYLNDATVDANLTPMTEREKYDACVALNQLAANSYNQSYLAAGTPIFSDDFARDTAYAALGLVKWKPVFAKSILSWFAQEGWPLLTTTDAVDVAGTAVPGEHPVDWDATYLYAVGKVYAETGDTTFANQVKEQVLATYSWAVTYYNSTDKHIDVSTSHTHDYWDQYAAAGTIDTASIKYEAEMDMLWSLALENSVSLLNIYGETAKAAWAAQTAADLRTKLSDYKTADNGYYFAIKTDDSLYSDFVSAPTNLTVAHLMNDLPAFNYLTANATNLSLAGIPWVNIGSTTYKSGVTNLIDIGTWFEISWAALSKRWGDADQYNHILTMNGLGYMPGSLRAESNDYIVGQHIENQSWGYGMLLGAIYDANFTYPTIMVNPSAVVTSSGATISWETNNNSSSKVNYGLTSAYGSATEETNTSPRVSTHTVSLSGLDSCTSYHYQVLSKDSFGTDVTSSDFTFTTIGCPVTTTQSTTTTTAGAPTCGNDAPSTAPFIYSATPISNTSVLLKFSEAKNADRYALEFGLKSGKYIYGAHYIGGAETKDYLVRFLSTGTTYYFRIRGGNGCATGPWSSEIKVITKGSVISGKINSVINKIEKSVNTGTKSNSVKSVSTETNFSFWQKVLKFFGFR
jgi:hypothetical protein